MIVYKFEKQYTDGYTTNAFIYDEGRGLVAYSIYTRKDVHMFDADSVKEATAHIERYGFKLISVEGN